MRSVMLEAMLGALRRSKASGGHRFARWARSFAQLALWLFVASTAQAAPPPEPILPGYTVQRIGAVRWTYPTSAEPEVQALAHEVDATWSALAERFGVRVSPELDLRVALNPEEMQALAPPGRTLPKYATGVAFPSEGLVLLSFSAPYTFERPNMEQLLVHELSHVALYRAVGGGENAERLVPRWLTEGVAVHEAGENTIARIRTLWEGALAGKLVPLTQLDSRFGAHHGAVDLAYAQSADLVAFMIDGDSDALRFRSLIAHVRAGVPFELAFEKAYGFTLAQLEKSWRERTARRFGRWPSLLVGLSALWGLAAVLLLVGYVRVRRRHRQTLERWAVEESDKPPQLVPIPPPPVVTSPPPPRSPDDVLDAWQEKQRLDGELPTVTHEGRSYTLH
jgi:hypothetical protein